MNPKPELPKITKEDSPVHESVETHPSYAQIGVTRVSASPGSYLYGSDFRHQHYMHISIKRSELSRGLHMDWPHAHEEYIEVALSEAQWASFVSSPNMGMGVQCTLRRHNGAMIPEIAATVDRKKQFKAELNADLKETITRLQNLQKTIDETKIAEKLKREIKMEIEQVLRELGGSSHEFLRKQFTEHVENTMEKAKMEVNAYVQAVIMRAGLKTLGANAPIELLEE